MAAMFGRKKLVDNIISKIKDMIIQGELKDGDMLASQDELAKTMGVSRASLREALNRLELMGLIESKQGRGTFVRAVAHTDFMNPLTSFLAMDRESALDLLEARGYIEGAMAALAAKNAGEDDIGKLEQVLTQMGEACDSEDLKRFVSMDVQFHMLVAEFSKNQVMARIGEIIRDLLHQLIRKVFDTAATSVSDLMNHTITLHRNVYDAIRWRDARSARKHMEFHIMDVKELILKSQNW